MSIESSANNKRIAKDNWTADTRYDRIQAVKGIIRPYFRKSTGEDVANDNWVIQVDNIMRLSTLEGTQYDFKAGFHTFKNSKFNKEHVKKCERLLTAAVNKGPNVTGYVLVGICEGQQTFKEFKTYYSTSKGSQYQNTAFYITGIDEEVKKFYAGSYDKYQNEILGIVRNEPIDDAAKHYILTHVRFPRYYDSTLMIMELKSEKSPVAYNDSYYEWQGNNAVEVTGVKGMKAIEARFAE